MLFEEAQRLFGQFLAPLTLTEFLDKTLMGGFMHLPGAPSLHRTTLLGADPEALLLGAYQLASKLTFHSANATGPPPSLEDVRDARDFQSRIVEFHARQYSVRFPELRPLSAPLDRFARALEMLLHQPVSASAFYSRMGMRAPVHCDDHDLIVIQLIGSKRWYVSTRASDLGNAWKGIPGDAPQLGAHEILMLKPGDALYLPRGTYHTVDSETLSLHLALGFTPLTAREALIAAVDHLSDLDRSLRCTVGGRLAYQLGGVGFDGLSLGVLDSLARVLAACKTPGFLFAALQRRSARVIPALAPLPSPAVAAPLSLSSMLRHTENAFAHLTANAEKIDVSYPGGHLFIHRGAQESVLYIVSTPTFRVRDIPGALDEEVRLSLAARFVEIGFLRVDAGPEEAGQ